MKKTFLAILFFLSGLILLSTSSHAVETTSECLCIGGILTGSRCGTLIDKPCTSSPIPTITPTPVIEPVPVNDKICPNNGTVYPPNSLCYDKVTTLETEKIGVNLIDSDNSIITYPLTCIPAPTVTYKETITGQISDIEAFLRALPPRAVTVSSDFSEAQLGFLGPNSKALASGNPDQLAKNYLYNALFDSPGAKPDASRESFRTFWRMLDSLSQAQLKAYYLQNTKEHTYFYVGKDFKQREVKISDLKKKLPDCLKTYDINRCWTNSLESKDKKYYLDDYLGLDEETKEQYDALLPFDFNNMRGYIANGTSIAEENIPYLRAILSGLKGYREDIKTPYYIPGIGFVSIPKTVIPGLFDYYTPSWALRPLDPYPTLGDNPSLLNLFQYPIINAVSLANGVAGGLFSYCTPQSSSSVSSPKTYPSDTLLDFTQIVDIPKLHPVLISQTPDECICKASDRYCYYRQCGSYASDSFSCNLRGCDFIKGESTYELTGTGTGIATTVFNNPNITNLTDLVAGGEPLITTTSKIGILQQLINLYNSASDKLVHPVQPSFYKMLLPDFASESASPKKLVSAPTIENTASPVPANENVSVTVSGSDTIYRENNLAQDTMHLLQNCWLVPADQQTSSKCGVKKPIVGECALSEEPLTETCNKASFAEYASGLSSTLSSFVPNVPPELSAVYAAAEKETGVSCVILAAIHYREGSNGLCTSLISGRKIGAEEPDNGNAVYSTLLETAIAAGNEFQGKYSFAQGKLGSGATKFQLLTLAFSYYNGGGNSNCLSDPPSSLYGQCPPLFKGEDDPYPLNFFDQRHANMYLRCLRDHDCSSSVPDLRPGVYTAALNYYNSLP